MRTSKRKCDYCGELAVNRVYYEVGELGLDENGDDDNPENDWEITETLLWTISAVCEFHEKLFFENQGNIPDELWHEAPGSKKLNDYLRKTGQIK
jgi:hypothetical protein